MTKIDHLLQVLKIGTQEQMAKELADFYTYYANFKELSFDGELAGMQSLIDQLFRIIRDPDMVNLCPLALQVIRVFCRVRTAGDMFPSDRIETLLHLAMLVGEEEAFMTENSQSFDVRIVVEAQKCISNLLSISHTVRKICCTNSCIEGIMLRLRMHPDPKLPHEVKYFDMLMLFLLTGMCIELRSKVKNEYHGLIYLMEAIDLILKNNAEYLAENMPNKSKRRSKGSRRGRKGTQMSSNDNDSVKDDTPDGRIDDTLVAYCLDDWEANIAIQVLKVLFSLTLNVEHSNMDEFEEAHFFRLVSILHDLLLCDAKNLAKKEELQGHIVNLLTNMPAKSFEELLSKIAELGKPENPEHEYDEMNMEVIAVLIKFLNSRLEETNKPDVNAKEKLSPILTCLIKAASSQPVIRKYIRYQILPPLKECKTRPEEGSTIRNKLVRLMTHPDPQLTLLAATFLFILCKESVGRLIKYTGYGNAAGLLASKGLLGHDTNSAYSSDSEDSDTEEYMKNADRINPVVGCIQEECIDPFKGMTEEQKEYEANNLVNLIDQLERSGIIRPCKIGEDGRPQPIDHVLELMKDTDTD